MLRGVMSTIEQVPCPHCQKSTPRYKNPVPTVDVIITRGESILLIKRKNPPYGWALPGGFVDYGETLEAAARREALEETGLTLGSLSLLGCYSDPKRDPRQHTITTVFIAAGVGTPRAADDADDAVFFDLTALPTELCFDHGQIIADYKKRIFTD